MRGSSPEQTGLIIISMFLEDVDPTVGRFRNLVTTAVISNKRQKTSDAMTEFFDSLE